MSLGIIGQSSASFLPAAGSRLPRQQGEVSVAAVEGFATTESRINLRSISPNEIRALNKELASQGIDAGLLDVLAFNSIDLTAAEGYTIDPNEKVDLIGGLERSIAFKQSRGLSTEVEQQILSKYLSVQGTQRPLSISAYA